jgi:hypothetical protein
MPFLDHVAVVRDRLARPEDAVFDGCMLGRHALQQPRRIELHLEPSVLAGDRLDVAPEHLLACRSRRRELLERDVAARRGRGSCDEPD